MISGSEVTGLEIWNVVLDMGTQVITATVDAKTGELYLERDY